jgi:hypothetical protein
MAERTIDIDIRCDADPAIEAIDRLKKRIGPVWLIMAIARWIALHAPWLTATALLATGMIGAWPWAMVTGLTLIVDALGSVRPVETEGRARQSGQAEDHGAKLREALDRNRQLHRMNAELRVELGADRALHEEFKETALREIQRLRKHYGWPATMASEGSPDPQP